MKNFLKRLLNKMKANSWCESGYVYAPYIPMQVTRPVSNYRSTFEFVAFTKENINKIISMHYIANAVQIKTYHKVANPLIRYSVVQCNTIGMAYLSKQFPLKIKHSLYWLKDLNEN